MSLVIEKAVRVFMFNGRKLQDPDPKQTPEEVKTFYAGIYPELTNAEIEGPTVKGAETVYELRKAVGTKGAGDPPVPAITLILNERQRQIHEEGWDAEHDDDHTDHELAAAACAYAAPEPYYRAQIDIEDLSIHTWDIWPSQWDQSWDKRLRGAPGSPFKDEIECRLPYSADDYTTEQRIRNLVKAGALIAAEIDRLIRKQAADAKA